MKLVRKPSILSFNPNSIITNPEILGKRIKVFDDEEGYIDEKEFADDGLFSKKIFGDCENTEYDYSCKCGNLRGKFYDGVVCEKCGEPVKFVEANIEKMGWIDLTGAKYAEDGTILERGSNYKIIKYVAYLFLEKIIGKENLKNIIHVPDIITVVGDLDVAAIEAERQSDPEKKYWYYGINDFAENYQEILDYYYKLHDIDNKELYDFVSNPFDTFTDKIPVISAVLRLCMRTADGLKLDEINNIYIRLIKATKILNNKTTALPIIKNSMLEEIQGEYFNLNEYVMDLIRGKEGLIRNSICGARVNFSARSIISPAFAGHKIDEIVVPYRTFLELYKFEIVNILQKVKNISYKEAEVIHFNAGIKFNDEVYSIMEKCIKDNEIIVLLNRNPSINIGSILALRITGVKHDFNDLTMSIHNSILTLLAGDYDGDVLNLFSIKDNATKELYKLIFSPINLLIDPKNGHFNESLNLERDQVLGLNALLH